MLAVETAREANCKNAVLITAARFVVASPELCGNYSDSGTVHANVKTVI